MEEVRQRQPGEATAAAAAAGGAPEAEAGGQPPGGRDAPFRAITEAMPQIVWSALPDGHHDYFNQRWYEFTGVAPGSTDGEGWNAIFHPEDQPLAWARWRHSLSTGEPYEIEYRLRHHDGAYRWVLGRALPLRDHKGAIIRWMGTCTDIHDQVLARETLSRSAEELEQQVQERTAQLMQLQKLENIGQLTGGIAHDFNNLLTPILGALDMLRRKGAADPSSARLIAGALQSAEKARTLVSRLLTFARRQTLRAEVVDLVQLVDGMTDLVRHSIGRHIEVVVEPAAAPAACRVDPNQLELAFLNLCVNARDAMPEGGRLTISVEQACFAPDDRPPLDPGDYVCLAVSDTGQGMDADTLARAVEPFFSTKGTGKGTGLGLSMVHGLAAQSGGGLFLFSAPGQGTRAEVWLPVAQAPSEDAVTAATLDVVPDRTLRLLLVEDEELVRTSTADMLRSLGHQVEECASGAEALERLRGPAPFDVVVTDYLMPDLNGVELAEQAAQLRPALPLLLITGYGGAPEVEHLHRLSKPFRAAEINAALAVLAQG